MKDSFWKYKFNDWSRDFTSLANPVVLLFVPFIFIYPTNPKVFYAMLITLVINEALGSLIKVFFHKKRPNNQEYSNVIEKIDAGSFPSLHSSRITIVYLTLFSFAHWLPLKIIFLSIIPIVMFSRINLKKHYLTDIIGGFVMGLLLWYFVPLAINQF